jgi:hypothetical protein
MKLVAVNGRRYSPEVLKAALKEGAGGSRPLELLVESREFYSTCAVDYHGGERHPWLERIPDRADLLAPIIAPRTPDAAAH